MTGAELHALYVQRAVRALAWAVTYEADAADASQPEAERLMYEGMARGYRAVAADWYARAARKTRYLPDGGFEAPGYTGRQAQGQPAWRGPRTGSFRCYG